MVVHHLAAQAFHQPVKHLGRMTLEERVGLPLAAHAVHDVRPVAPGLHHVHDGMHIVLQVRIDGHSRRRMAGSPLQSGPKCLLVARVVRQLQSADPPVGGSVAANQLPRPVAGTVVHIQEPSASNRPPDRKLLQYARQLPRGLGQDLLLIITRYDDDQIQHITSPFL